MPRPAQPHASQRMARSPSQMEAPRTTVCAMADIVSARATAESSTRDARNATTAFEDAVADWQKALRDAVPMTILTQVRRHVEGQPHVSRTLGRDKIQELKIEAQQLAGELAKSIPDGITPENVRSAQPVRGINQVANAEQITKAARHEVVETIAMSVRQLVERYDFTWDGLITDDPWSDASTVLADQAEVVAAQKVASTLSKDKAAAKNAERAAEALNRAEAASLWD